MTELGPLMHMVEAARIRSMRLGRQIWIERRHGRFQMHLAHRRGWELWVIVAGEEMV